MKKQKLYIAIAYLWSYILWIGAIYISETQGISIQQNEILLESALAGELSLTSPAILSFLAGFGPLVSALLLFFSDKNSKDRVVSLLKGNVAPKYFFQLLLIIFSISVLPVIVASFISPDINFNNSASLGYIVNFIIIFTLYQFFTAGTEEIGWRGYLLPEILKGNTTLWKASLKVGLTWAFWHLPILIYIYIQQGLTLGIIPLSIIGFTAGTVAMSVLHTYYLMRTKNILFSMLIHALFNSVPMFLGLLFSNVYLVSLIAQVGLWVVIAIIEKREGKIFDEKYQF